MPRATIAGSPQQWGRVAASVRARREALDLIATDIAAEPGGVSPATLSLIENSSKDRFSTAILRRLSQRLLWTPDSIERILAGDDPVPLGGDGEDDEAAILEDGPRFRMPGYHVPGVTQRGRQLTRIRNWANMLDSTADLLELEAIVGRFVIERSGLDLDQVMPEQRPPVSEEDKQAAVADLMEVLGAKSDDGLLTPSDVAEVKRAAKATQQARRRGAVKGRAALRPSPEPADD